MRYYFMGPEEQVVDFYQDGNRYYFEDTGEKKEVKIREVNGKKFYSLDGKSWSKLLNLSSIEKVYKYSDEFKIYRGFKPSGQGETDAGSLVSQMPGKVVKVIVNAGDVVKKGDTLLILEAMKMENEIKAAIDGTVEEVNVSEGESIDTGTLMVALSASES